MTVRHDALIGRLRQRLLEGANKAGWGYYAGKTSRVEPTSWALLALSGADQLTSTGQSLAPHVGYLSTLQASDGLLVETEPALANLASNGLAAITMASPALSGDGVVLQRLRDGLIRLKGVRLEQVDPRQDSTLQGWPWVRDTFSWVEPTAWCMLALKRAPSALAAVPASARVKEAERLLANRMCTGGGWNFGNATALGQDLRPYVPTTAVALMALQDRKADADVQQSLALLRNERLSEQGAMTLALVSICLRLFDADTEDVDERLAETVTGSEEAGNIQAMAMTLFALSGHLHRGDALRVA